MRYVSIMKLWFIFTFVFLLAAIFYGPAYGTAINASGQDQCSVCYLTDKITNAIKESNDKLTDKITEAIKENVKQKDQMATLESKMATLLERYLPKSKGKDCADIYKNGEKLSGVYTISPSDQQGQFDVYCDMVTDGGGWTVFQKRQDGSVDFYRGWQEYKAGFGNLNGEFWMGNDKLNRLTNQGKYILRVDLEDTSGTQVYAKYDSFDVSAEATKYQLSLGTYSGNAGDSFSVHKGLSFSTKDRDNDVHPGENCAAESARGAWWYGRCFASGSNLNGVYHHGPSDSYGVSWHSFKGHLYSLKRADMKIRPIGFQAQK